jgi:hypothetical protein
MRDCLHLSPFVKDYFRKLLTRAKSADYKRPMAKDVRMHFRLDPVAREKLQRACELTGLDEPSAMRACIQAFIEHIEENGGIWLPLAIVPKSGAPPGKIPARRGQQTAGPVDAEAARGGSSASPRAPIHSVNEDAPIEIPPIVPAREKSGSPRMTRTRAALRKMTEREGGK